MNTTLASGAFVSVESAAAAIASASATTDDKVDSYAVPSVQQYYETFQQLEKSILDECAR